MTKLYELSVKSAADIIVQKMLTSRELVEACIQRIDEIEENIQAWSYIDPDYALAYVGMAHVWGGALSNGNSFTR